MKTDCKRPNPINLVFLLLMLHTVFLSLTISGCSKWKNEPIVAAQDHNERITIAATGYVIGPGQTAQLSAVVKANSQATSPEQAAGDTFSREVLWQSSDESIARIDGDGLVQGIAPGTVIITITDIHDHRLLDGKILFVSEDESDL